MSKDPTQLPPEELSKLDDLSAAVREEPMEPGFLGALKLVLAYATSGTAKLLSPVWREGNALAGVLSTHAFGLR